jgi:hypothetical protein
MAWWGSGTLTSYSTLRVRGIKDGVNKQKMDKAWRHEHILFPQLPKWRSVPQVLTSLDAT